MSRLWSVRISHDFSPRRLFASRKIMQFEAAVEITCSSRALQDRRPPPKAAQQQSRETHIKSETYVKVAKVLQIQLQFTDMQIIKHHWQKTSQKKRNINNSCKPCTFHICTKYKCLYICQYVNTCHINLSNTFPHIAYLHRRHVQKPVTVGTFSSPMSRFSQGHRTSNAGGTTLWATRPNLSDLSLPKLTPKIQKSKWKGLH